MNSLYIGIMSGTSMDAVDAVILDTTTKANVLTHCSTPFPKQLHQDLSDLITTNQTSLSNLGYLNIALAELYVEAVEKLLQKAKLSASQISAIGCHGQTVFHQPEGQYRFSTQLGSASYIAEKTSITTVSDFRNRDMAAGGQGAPLVPAFHKDIFGHDDESSAQSRMIINIGGIANCTWLPVNGDVIGFDTGPGNTLMDGWINHCHNKPYDKGGCWAASGTVSEKLLQQLLSDNYFKKSPPKSTGREYFNLDWLQQSAGTLLEKMDNKDIQATLVQLTACSIADAINQFNPKHSFLCGGGVHNAYLIEQINNLTESCVQDTNELGLNPDFVEAAAFAWLAKKCLHNQTGTLPSVTGAQHPVISGAIYPA